MKKSGLGVVVPDSDPCLFTLTNMIQDESSIENVMDVLLSIF